MALARFARALQRSSEAGSSRCLSGIAFQKVDRVAWDGAGDLRQQQEAIMAQDQPLVITGALDGWPIRKWSFSSLREQYGDTVVPLELSKRGGDYRSLFLTEPTATHGQEFEPDVEVPLATLLDHLEDRKSQAEFKLYLAQKGIADVLPGLDKQLGPAPFPVANERIAKQSIWLGPAGTTTPLHHDPYLNLYCQVWGTKQIWLVDPDQTDRVKPFKTPLVLRNTSTTDISDLTSGDGSVTAWQCNLQEGEVLYIPRKWWHQVEALSNSLSFSFWWT